MEEQQGSFNLQDDVTLLLKLCLLDSFMVALFFYQLNVYVPLCTARWQKDVSTERAFFMLIKVKREIKNLYNSLTWS